jgi:hypothetical protein
MVTFRFLRRAPRGYLVNPTPRLQDVIYFDGGEDVMIRMVASLAFVMLWTVSIHAQQPANSRLDDIIKRGTLRVGMTGDYQPFTYSTRPRRNSAASGTSVDVSTPSTK